MSRFRFSTLLSSLIFFGPAAFCGDNLPEIQQPSSEVELIILPPKVRHDRGVDFIVLPIPILNPTVGSGLGFTAALLYDIDDKSQVSFTGIGGFRTSNGSKGYGLFQQTNFMDGLFRTQVGLGGMRVNYDFYGVGNVAGDLGLSIPISQKGYAIVASAMIRVVDNLYIGPKFRYMTASTTLRFDEIFGGEVGLVAVPPLEIDIEVGGLGAVLQFDTKDNSFNPQSGWLIDFEALFNSPTFGSDFTYQTYTLALNYYHRLDEKQVLATRLSVCSSAGKTPFFDLCLFGNGSDLRGYVSGQYRDRHMATLQVEYRRQVYKKFGAVVFAGIGAVAPEFADYGIDDLLHSYGVGFRYLASVDFGVNLSLDIAKGKNSEAIYFRIGEAF